MKRIIVALALATAAGGCATLSGPVLVPAPEVPPTADEATARLEKALAKSGITVADVAAFVFQYGWTLMPIDDWIGWHWNPSTGPVSYYVATIRCAVGDTLMPVYFKNPPPGPYSVQVEAIAVLPNGTFLRSPKSLVGWSTGNGSDALPGVADGVAP